MLSKDAFLPEPAPFSAKDAIDCNKRTFRDRAALYNSICSLVRETGTINSVLAGSSLNTSSFVRLKIYGFKICINKRV